jgi:hypothetical protein
MLFSLVTGACHAGLQGERAIIRITEFAGSNSNFAH